MWKRAGGENARRRKGVSPLERTEVGKPIELTLHKSLIDHDVLPCGIGFGGGQCPSLADYVTEPEATRAATAAGGC